MAAAGPSDGKRCRILCIDDDPDILTILRSTLGLQHEVLAAKDGLEAIAMLDYCDADFVVCDVRMPFLDGIQTVEAIRRHPAYGDVPVFFLTAETDREMAKKGFAAGGNLYLTKPFDPMRLLKNINYFLQESEHKPREKRLTIEAVTQLAKAPPAPPAEETAAPPARPLAPAARPAPPVAQPAPAVSRPAPRASSAVSRATLPPQTGKPRVIIICANEPQLERLRKALAESVECVGCADPLAALQRLFRYEPDVLLINPAIPRLSGWGLVQMIAQNPRLKGLPVIVVEDPEQPIDPRLVGGITRQPLLPADADGAEIAQALERVVQAPGFRVHPKQLPVETLLREEEEALALIENEQLQQSAMRRAKLDRYRRIQAFIDSEMR